MKKTVTLLLTACFCASGLFAQEQAQAPTFPEPEFIGHVLLVRGDEKTEQLTQESFSPRRRASTGAILFAIGKQHIDEMVLNGLHAPVRFKSTDPVAFIIRVPDNAIDPMSVVSIIRFKTKKKMRIAEYASVDTFGNLKTNTLDRQPFTSRRFGSSSYLVILKDVRPGEYGITVDVMGSLNVSTFGVDK